jgi:hypothetical protein
MTASVDNTLHVVPFAITAVVIAALVVWHSWRSHSLLKEWAAAHGFEILRSEYRNIARGPFSWSSRGQAVYYVTVRDSKGAERSGWVNCGGRFFGLLPEKTEVKWEHGL